MSLTLLQLIVRCTRVIVHGLLICGVNSVYEQYVLHDITTVFSFITWVTDYQEGQRWIKNYYAECALSIKAKVLVQL